MRRAGREDGELPRRQFMRLAGGVHANVAVERVDGYRSRGFVLGQAAAGVEVEERDRRPAVLVESFLPMSAGGGPTFGAKLRRRVVQVNLPMPGEESLLGVGSQPIRASAFFTHRESPGFISMAFIRVPRLAYSLAVVGVKGRIVSFRLAVSLDVMPKISRHLRSTGDLSKYVYDDKMDRWHWNETVFHPAPTTAREYPSRGTRGGPPHACG